MLVDKGIMWGVWRRVEVQVQRLLHLQVSPETFVFRDYTAIEGSILKTNNAYSPLLQVLLHPMLHRAQGKLCRSCNHVGIGSRDSNQWIEVDHPLEFVCVRTYSTIIWCRRQTLTHVHKPLFVLNIFCFLRRQRRVGPGAA